jgi:hypothetical protein
MHSRAGPCRVGLNQHVLELHHIAISTMHWNDETETNPRDTGKGQAPRGTPAEGKEFWHRAHVRKESQSEPRCRINPAREFFSIG